MSLHIITLRYGLADFQLSNGIEVVGVHTVLSKNILSTNRDIKDVLITHWDTVTINHNPETPIKYRRIGHKDFKYQIQIRNSRRIKRKVFIRLWLGILERQNDIRLSNLLTNFNDY